MTHPLLEAVNKCRDVQSTNTSKPVITITTPLPDNEATRVKKLNFLLRTYGEKSFQYVAYCLEQSHRENVWTKIKQGE